tara:strand:- start:5727 stop:5960 length:234 start_codon:yes stop_codon:yes gene_type:complete
MKYLIILKDLILKSTLFKLAINTIVFFISWTLGPDGVLDIDKFPDTFFALGIVSSGVYVLYFFIFMFYAIKNTLFSK